MQQIIPGYIFTGRTRCWDSTLCNLTVLYEIILYVYISFCFDINVVLNEVWSRARYLESGESTIDSEGFKGGTRGAPLCRETQSLGQQMLNAPVGINGLTSISLCVQQVFTLAANLIQTS